jgi:hypothetical protein
MADPKGHNVSDLMKKKPKIKCVDLGLNDAEI